MANTQKKRLAGAAVIVMSSIVLSRITGFFRELLIPNVFTSKEVSDAYIMAFRVTDLMYNLLVGGAIAAALIPVLTGYIEKDQEEDGWKAVGTFINVTFLLMGFLCLLGIIFAPNLVPLVAIGFKGEATELTIRLTRILFPSVSFLMLAGLTNGVLNSYQRFAAAAYGPTVYNIGGALSLLILGRYSVEMVAYGVMFSSLLYFLFQLSFAIKNLKFFKLKLYLKHPGFLRIFKLAIPSLMSSSIVQVNVIITSMFTSLFSAGSITALNMADKTWQLPYGIFAQGMGIAMLPTLSARLAVGEVKMFKSILNKGLKSVLLLTVPSAVGFIILREPIIRAIFKWTKRLTDVDITSAGNILMFFSIALLTQSVVAIMNRAFYANNDTKTPLYIGVSTLVVNSVLSYAFYRFTTLDAAGMALSYSLASTLNAVFLLAILDRKMNGIYLKKLILFLIRIIPASLAMGLTLFILEKFINLNNSPKTIEILFLAFEVALGAAVYLLTVLLMKVEEAVYMFEAVTGKIKNIGRKFSNKL